jgi:hypothetical protein
MLLPIKKTVRIKGAVPLEEVPPDSRPMLMSLTALKFGDPILTKFNLKEELVLPNSVPLLVRKNEDLIFSYELLMQTATPMTTSPYNKMDDLKMRIDRIFNNLFAVNISKLDCLDQPALNTQVLLFFLAEKAQAEKTFMSRLYPYPARQTNPVAEIVDFQVSPY